MAERLQEPLFSFTSKVIDKFDDVDGDVFALLLCGRVSKMWNYRSV